MRSALIRRADVIAFALLVLTAVVAAAAIGMQVRDDLGPDAQIPERTAELVAWGLTASILLVRRPDLSFGWIFATGAVVEVVYLGVGVPAAVAFDDGHGSSALLWAYSLAGIQWVPDVLLGLVFCRFPTGAPAGRTWVLLDRVIRWGVVVGACAGLLEDWNGTDAVAGTSRFIDGTPVPSIASALLVVLPLLVLLTGVAGVNVVVRWYRARDLERRQLAWMAGGAVVTLLGWPVAATGHAPPWLLAASAFVAPAALLVAILRYDLWAIDSIVRRSASYHLRGGGTLDGIVHATSDLLRLPYVAVCRGAVVVASVGQAQDDVERWPIDYEGEVLGELVCAPRFGREQISSQDRVVLASTTRLVAGSLRTEVLTADLLDARQRLIAAREEERRRMRRDLHDGIGPMLTGLGLNLDAARADPDRANEYLATAKDASGEVIRTLRALVYDLRPPNLDELGFAGALKLQVAHVAGTLQATTTVPDALDLPAAVEVAALRTAVEAVHNVVKHAGATRVDVVVEVGTALTLTVVDDGTGHDWGMPGVGLASMRERADELGGTFTAGPGPSGGRVRATYPLEVLT
ncbi:hypothetical protein IC607_06045 [Cellulomonas sp. JH27-2]|uniref:sensor histidine kinase n=1 Tax=Cellulomonas sp. JH27-2 TaxID=2774139 RepID=UPI0017838A97|nr:hypothetical protein [Cellulomonas sp. JH27-2]